MKNYRNFYFVLGITLIIFISFFFFREIIFKSEKLSTKNDELKLLKQIFPDTSIISQDNKEHYVINEKDYYVKSIGDVNHDGLAEFIVMELVQNQGKTYSFYTNENEQYVLIGQEVSLIWHLEDEKNKEMEIILKDITGDDIKEFLIPILTSATNITPYHILIFDNKTKKLVTMLRKDYFSEEPETSIIFDEIRREDNFVITIGHGGHNKTKLYYLIEENVLNFKKSIGVYGEPGISGEYEYREIDKNGNVVYQERRKGNFWLDESIK